MAAWELSIDMFLPHHLADAITNLYSVFARYPLPSQTNYSPYASISPDDAQALRARPLRELDGRELSKFSMRALTTWGDEDEFRHYLPRMLELLVVEPSWTDIGMLFHKLTTGRWRTWPEDEQWAVEKFVEALSQAIVAGEVPRISIADLALGASNSGIDLGPMCTLLETAPGVVAVLELAYLLALEEPELLRAGRFGQRWSDDARDRLGHLVRLSSTRQRLEAAFFELDDPAKQSTVSAALQVLDAMPAD